ncbi:MAG TPA: hypothetical protein V6C95_06535 [Coleofasciculaceae cyanobacterium]
MKSASLQILDFHRPIFTPFLPIRTPNLPTCSLWQSGSIASSQRETRRIPPDKNGQKMGRKGMDLGRLLNLRSLLGSLLIVGINNPQEFRIFPSHFYPRPSRFHPFFARLYSWSLMGNVGGFCTRKPHSLSL